MLKSPIRIVAYALMVALCAIAHPALAQVAPRMTIDSIPPGANVIVDGALQGQSGPNFKVRITKGSHKLRLELDGHKPLEQTINVSTAQKLTFQLEKGQSSLDIKFPATNDAAKGGEVFVDGVPSGTVPVLVNLPPGRHLVEVRKPGQKAYTETIEVKAAETRAVWVTMQADQRVGSLLIAADVTADVLVDGQPRGQAPIVVDNLNEGEHLVEVRRAEPGAPPWRQTVRVAGNQQTKVFAQTTPPPPAAGSIMIVSNVLDVEVFIDGAPKGSAGVPINVPPGQHSVMVQSKGHKPVLKVVDVEPGKPRVERIDLEGDNATKRIGVVRVIMSNPVDGAQYFINGRKIDESAALSDQGVEVASGNVIVVVKKEGFGQVKREIQVGPGATETVTIELRNVGKIYFATEPRGAYVMLDRVLIGQTPLTRENVSAGQHTYELSKQGFEPIGDTITVIAGDTANVSAIMRPPAPKPVDKLALQKGLSSFSAIVHDAGHFTGDIAAGYPYFASLRLTVGALKAKIEPVGIIGLDVGAEFRTNLYSDTNVGANLRFQFLQKGPFALGVQTYLGGGGGPRGRNTFTWELGLPITLIAGDLVKLTARPYLQVYTDRYCPDTETLNNLAKNDLASLVSLGDPIKGAEHTGDRCVGRSYNTTGYMNPIYAATGYDPLTGGLTSKPSYIDVNTGKVVNQDYLVDGNGVLDRFVGARLVLQAIAEVSLTPNASMFFIFEGAPPGQKVRQLYTDKFNRFYPIEDIGVYGRIGFTLKY